METETDACPHRNPKTLSDWLDIDSPTGPRPIRFLGWRVSAGRLWGWLLLTPLVVGMLLVAAWFAWPASRVMIQAGPLSPSHRLFTHDCGQCHTGSFQTVQRLWEFDGEVTSVSDEACSKCHAGPKHHEDQIRDSPCASCHREHHGRPSLAHIGDTHCLSCHRDLKDGVKPGATVHFADVAGFANHPEFVRRWEGGSQDPGTIAFNHKVHLQPEGVLVLDPKQAGRPAGAPLSIRVLQCNDCHQPDEAGRYMKPIRYESHCKQCHPLSVRLTAAGSETRASAALERFAAEPAPHQAPAVARSVLRERLTRFIQENDRDFLNVKEKLELPRPIPGAWPSPPPVTKEQFDFVNQHLGKVEKQLFNNSGGCRQCHQEQHPEKRNKDGLPVYAPSRINQRTFPLLGDSPRWFPHSRFRHDSHRMLNCGECHAARDSEKTSDVLLPTIASCRSCHKEGGQGGARGDCVECHTYHPRSEVRKFQGELTIGAFSETGKRD